VLIFAWTLAVWVLLRPILTVEYLALGVLCAAGIAWFLKGYAFEGAPRAVLDPRRWIYFMIYLAVLVRGILLAGILLVPIILSREINIRPGVVAIPTRLKKRWELTLLANSITLTPGTFFLDMSEEEGVMYVHWISIRSDRVDEMRRMITESYERMLSKVFE
jgi:multicomponent Na+:H+ antiporter subunit E